MRVVFIFFPPLLTLKKKVNKHVSENVKPLLSETTCISALHRLANQAGKREIHMQNVILPKLLYH